MMIYCKLVRDKIPQIIEAQGEKVSARVMEDEEFIQQLHTKLNEEVAEFLIADNIYEQADAMIDLMYFALGTMVEMGLEADELFEIVQQANMAKLWPDGKPHYNPKDGKVIKPDTWEDPAPKIKAYIDSVIERKKSSK